MDPGTIIGLVLAFGGILLALVVEGGSLRSLLNLPAALIVFGGTYGATIACCDFKVFLKSAPNTLKAIMGKTPSRAAIADKLVEVATTVRKQGLLSLESELDSIENPVMRKSLQLVIDGLDSEMVEETMHKELRVREAEARHDSAFFTTWGGLGPTLGVTGTVMGLVNMMAKLDNPSDMGPAIAAAFTATLYGVATANLVFLPVGKKLALMAEQERIAGDMVIEGVRAIQEGATPLTVRLRLEAYLVGGKPSNAKAENKQDGDQSLRAAA